MVGGFAREKDCGGKQKYEAIRPMGIEIEMMKGTLREGSL